MNLKINESNNRGLRNFSIERIKKQQQETNSPVSYSTRPTGHLAAKLAAAGSHLKERPTLKKSGGARALAPLSTQARKEQRRTPRPGDDKHDERRTVYPLAYIYERFCTNTFHCTPATRRFRLFFLKRGSQSEPREREIVTVASCASRNCRHPCRLCGLGVR